MTTLSTEKVRELYALYATEEESQENEDPIAIMALATVFKAERFLTEQYESAAWNTAQQFAKYGTCDKNTMMSIAVLAHESDENRDPIAIDVFRQYIAGECVQQVIKTMILNEFASVFSLEGFYASCGVS